MKPWASAWATPERGPGKGAGRSCKEGRSGSRQECSRRQDHQEGCAVRREEVVPPPRPRSGPDGVSWLVRRRQGSRAGGSRADRGRAFLMARKELTGIPRMRFAETASAWSRSPVCEISHTRDPLSACSSLRRVELSGWEDPRPPPGGRVWAAWVPLVGLRRVLSPGLQPSFRCAPVTSPARAGRAAGRSGAGSPRTAPAAPPPRRVGRPRSGRGARSARRS
jgi:hypothetical protein